MASSLTSLSCSHEWSQEVVVGQDEHKPPSTTTGQNSMKPSKPHYKFAVEEEWWKERLEEQQEESHLRFNPTSVPERSGGTSRVRRRSGLVVITPEARSFSYVLFLARRTHSSD